MGWLSGRIRRIVRHGLVPFSSRLARVRCWVSKWGLKSKVPTLSCRRGDTLESTLDSRPQRRPERQHELSSGLWAPPPLLLSVTWSGGRCLGRCKESRRISSHGDHGLRRVSNRPPEGLPSRDAAVPRRLRLLRLVYIIVGAVCLGQAQSGKRPRQSTREPAASFGTLDFRPQVVFYFRDPSGCQLSSFHTLCP